MNEQARKDLPGVTASEWAQCGYESDTKFAPNDLDCELNEIFHFKYLGREHWTLTIEDHDRLKPTLRLSTLLLESPGSVRYLYDLAHAPKVEIPGGKPDAPWSQFSSSDETDSEVRARMLEIWHQLAQRVTFDPTTELPANLAGECVEEYVSDHEEPNAHEEYSACGPLTINIRKVLLDDLNSLLKEKTAADIRVLYSQLDLAILLCHELAHAVTYLHNRYSSIEPFFNGDRCAEVGYAWEQQVLGGTLLGLDKLTTPPLGFVHQWPTFGPIEQDSDGSAGRAKRDKPLAPPSTVEWLVDLHHVANLQQRAFWHNLPNDWKACHFPKLVGKVDRRDEGAYKFLPHNSKIKKQTYFGDAAGEYTLTEYDGVGLINKVRIVRVRWMDPAGSLGERWAY